MTTRSYRGCTRCKRRRQKCDETKPSCGRCLLAEVACSYSLNLKWAGRVPRTQESSRKKKTPPSTTTTEASTAAVQDSKTLSNLQLIRTTANIGGPENIIVYNLDPFGLPSPVSRLLLHHFVTQSSTIVGHARLRDQLCQQTLPVAVQLPSLMCAIMALAALHLMTSLGEIPESFIPETMISNLLTNSLHHLRQELETNDPMEKQYLLLTIMILCTCEIYSGKADSSWRVHVAGARAILESSQPRIEYSGSDEWLPTRWYQSMEALAGLTNDTPITVDVMRHSEHLVLSGDQSCLDLYKGYTQDLNLVLKEVGIAAWKRRRLQCDTRKDSMISDIELQRQADRLENKVRSMIHRDTEGLQIPTDLALTTEEIRQYSACNTAYQYSALIHIHRRIRMLGSRSTKVQWCVGQILDAVGSIEPVEALTPWALLSPPIFTAGSVIWSTPKPEVPSLKRHLLTGLFVFSCEAFGKQREQAKTLLQELYETLGVRNNLRGVKILEREWQRSDNGSDAPPGTGSPETWDFIPY